MILISNALLKLKRLLIRILTGQHNNNSSRLSSMLTMSINDERLLNNLLLRRATHRIRIDRTWLEDKPTNKLLPTNNNNNVFGPIPNDNVKTSKVCSLVSKDLFRAGYLFRALDYYAAQLARQQQQQEHAAQAEAAQQRQRAQEQQQQQPQQVISADQPTKPVGIKVGHSSLKC